MGQVNRQPTWRELRKMNTKDFAEFVKTVITEREVKDKTLSIKFPYDLRASLPTKAEEADQDANWTAFVNNSGKLVHVVAPDAEILIRLQFGYGLKHLNEQRQEKSVRNRLKNWVRI